MHGQPTVLPITAAIGLDTVLAGQVSAAEGMAALPDAVADTTADGAADVHKPVTDLRHFNAVLGNVGLSGDRHRVLPVLEGDPLATPRHEPSQPTGRSR